MNFKSGKTALLREELQMLIMENNENWNPQPFLPLVPCPSQLQIEASNSSSATAPTVSLESSGKVLLCAVRGTLEVGHSKDKSSTSEQERLNK